MLAEASERRSRKRPTERPRRGRRSLQLSHPFASPIHLAAEPTGPKRYLSGWESNPAFPRFASSDKRVYYPIYDQRVRNGSAAALILRDGPCDALLPHRVPLISLPLAVTWLPIEPTCAPADCGHDHGP
jgi:hypothetical protein